jgi:hypothetical protein
MLVAIKTLDHTIYNTVGQVKGICGITANHITDDSPVAVL